MAHAPQITARLPQIYAQGAILRSVVDQPALAMEIADEDMLEVQRAHWFDQALELDETAGLAAILDFAPEPWQDLFAFRAWVHALRTAILTFGSTGVRALQVFVEEYVRRVTSTAGVPRLLLRAPTGADDWLTAQTLIDADPGERNSRTQFLENPHHLSTHAMGMVAPLTQVTVRNGGLDASPAGALLVGLPGGPEYVPVLVNVTTGQAVAYLGEVRQGQRLWLGADGIAHLERRDVTNDVRSITAVTPGVPWTAADVEPRPRALQLQPGDNHIWFLPVAHYDRPGLDRVLLALATLDMEQGIFDKALFDSALFVQDPAVRLTLAWRQAEPATVDVNLPGGLLLAVTEGTEAALELREQTGSALHLGVDTLAAAGVVTSVRLAPFAEQQPSRDFLTVRHPLVHREAGPTGADAMPDSGGVFDVTPYEDSTFS